MADLVYPVYIDGLAIYSITLHPELEPNDPISDGSILQTLEWRSGDGYTNALDQLCAVQACARVLGHDEANIGLVALIHGRWIVIKQSSLSMAH
jgi:hypothetical protein